MSRTRRSVWSVVTGLGASGGLMVLGLVATPFLLRWLGDERLGAFRTATDWAGYLALFELGLGGALQAMLARAVGQGDDAEVARVLAVSIRTFGRLTLVLVAAGAALALAIPWLVPLEGDMRRDLQTGFWLGLLGLMWTPFGPFRTLAEASQRGYLVNALILVQSLTITASSLFLAWAGCGITGQYLGLLLGGVPFFLVLAWDGWRRYPQLGVALRHASGPSAHRAALWSLNWPMLVHNLCGRLSLMTDNIVISLVMGPIWVVPFFVTQRLVALAGNQVAILGNSTWAALAELHTQGQRERFNQRLIQLTHLSAVIGLAVVLPIALFTPAFVRLWVGSERYGGDLVTLLAACNAFLFPLLSLWGWVFSGTGQVGRLMPMLIVHTAVNLAVSIGATFALGLPGPLLGTTVGYVGISLWWEPWLLRRCFDTPLRPLFQAVGQPLMLGLPLGVVLYWFTRSHQPQTWIGLMLALAATCGLYLAGAWWLVLAPNDRAALRQRWLALWARRQPA